MTRFAIALGSNLGDRLWHLRTAVVEIAESMRVDAVSGLYETAPVGGPEQDPFLNAVVIVETEEDPIALLARLHEIEAAHDRRRVERWGPRSLDLDIVAGDGPPIDLPDLVVPHPRTAERRFVVRPLAEVWPEAPIGSDRTAAETLPSLRGQDVDLLRRNWVDARRRIPGLYWVLGQLVLFAMIGVALMVDGALPSQWSAIRIVGIIIALGGLGVIAASAMALGSNLTALPEPLGGGELVRAGPYRYVRHPMYTGVVALFLGTALVVGSLPAVALTATLLAFFFLKSSYEERELRVAYPGYMAYRSEVPARFAPHLF